MVFDLLELILGSLCSTSFAILIWQWAGTLIFPLDKCLSETSFQPELTVFKPVKGLEDQTLECLVSWLRQDYKGKIRYLFGVAEEDDPVLPHLRALIKQFPHLDIQVIVCRENRGLNQKVSNLIQMSFYATGMVWIISDADIYAEPYLVRNLVQPLRDSSVGAVHCLYRLTGPQGFADALERIGNNVDFWSQVIQSRQIAELDYCLGATMAVNADFFRKTGGFEPLGNLLADDYHIGHRIHRFGKKVILSHLVVESRIPKSSFRQVWAHQLRWARTIRFERPVSYALSILSNSTLWSLIWLLFGESTGRFYCVALVLIVRLFISIDLQRRFTGGWSFLRYAGMIWLRDLFQFFLWGMAFAGSQVVWREKKFRVSHGGVLTPSNE